MTIQERCALAKLYLSCYPGLVSGNKNPPHIAYAANLIQDALEKKSEKYQMLLVSMAPRHGKTELISKHLPSWILGKYPKKRIILTSYGAELSDKNSDVARAIFEKWGNILFNVNPSKTMFKRSAWDTEQGGGVVSAGIGGAIVGFGADCLDGETLIETNRGKIKIKDINIGDMALSLNEDFYCVYNKVVAKKTSYTDEIYEIIIDTSTIKVTAKHRFYVIGKGYVCAKDLSMQDICIIHEQNMLRIRPISLIKIIPVKNHEMYDIQVAKTNTFFANKVFVHNCFIIDDFVKGAEQAESKIVRDKTWDWWQAVAATRLHPGAIVIVVATRWSCDDLIGRLLKQREEEGDEFPFEVTFINLPAIADKNDVLDRKPGEALWPWRYNEKMLMNIKKILGSYWWNAMYMGSPVERGGTLFKTENFRYYEKELSTGDYLCYLPGHKDPIRISKKSLIKRVYADPALETKLKNDPSGALAWAYDRKHKFWLLLDRLNDRIEHTKMLNTLLTFAFKNNCISIGIENEKIGKIIVKQSAGNDRVGGIPIPFKEIKCGRLDKYARATPMASYIENERVFFPKNAPWLANFEDNITKFPHRATHDEDVDCLAYAQDMEEGISVAEALANRR